MRDLLRSSTPLRQRWAGFPVFLRSIRVSGRPRLPLPRHRGVQRLAEVVYAQINTRRLLARGAVEIGRNHYPVMVAMHVAWLVTIVAMLPHPGYPLDSGGAALPAQFGRLWTMHVGPCWTTRIITLPARDVHRGPYRFMRHPNYAVVVLEFSCFPGVRRDGGCVGFQHPERRDALLAHPRKTRRWRIGGPGRRGVNRQCSRAFSVPLHSSS